MSRYSEYLRIAGVEGDKMVERLWELIGAEKGVAERFEGRNVDAIRSAIHGIAEFQAMLTWSCTDSTLTLDAVYEAARGIVVAFFVESNVVRSLPPPWTTSVDGSSSVEPALNRLRHEIDEYRARFLAGGYELDVRGVVIWLWEMVGRSYLLLGELARGANAPLRR